MERVTVAEFRQNLASWLDRARNGEAFEVTRRGEVIARVLPAVGRQEDARARLAALRGRLILGEVDVSLAADDWDAES